MCAGILRRFLTKVFHTHTFCWWWVKLYFHTSAGEKPGNLEFMQKLTRVTCGCVGMPWRESHKDIPPKKPMIRTICYVAPEKEQPCFDFINWMVAFLLPRAAKLSPIADCAIFFYIDNCMRHIAFVQSQFLSVRNSKSCCQLTFVYMLMIIH